jgi:hypothetical protein
VNINSVSAPTELWYKLPKEEMGRAMVEHALAIEAGQTGRREENLKFAIAYANRDMGSLYDLAAPARDRSVAPWALISAVVGTGESMTVRNQVRLSVETSGAKTRLRREAKEAGRWIAGVFAANKVSQEIAPTLFRWAAVCNLGLAVTRVEEKDGKRRLVTDTVIPDEIVVADPECLGGRPKQGFIKRYMALEVALERWGDDPEKRAAIEAAQDDCPAFQDSYRPRMVALWEGWAQNGAHIVAVGGCTLDHEDWPFDFLPWAPMYIERPLAGYWGRGWAQMLFGYQCQLWDINDSIDEQRRLGASPKWMKSTGSNVNDKALSNEHMGIVEHAPGQAPQLVQYNAIHKDLFEERRNCWQQGLADVGMSDWGVSGENPGELSGEAFDRLTERETGRMVSVGQEYEAFHCRLGEIYLKMGHLVQDWPVMGTGPGEKELKQVDFKRIAKLIEQQPWTVQPPAPISAFPSSPAGKRQQVERWVEKSVMTPQDAAMALDLPDNDAESSLLYTVREWTMRRVEDIIEKGAKGYKPPEAAIIQVGGAMPAQLAMKLYLEAQDRDEDEENLDWVLQWIAECDTLAGQLGAVAAPAPVQAQQVQIGGTTFAPPAVDPAAAAGMAPPPAAVAPEVAPPEVTDPGLGAPAL